MMEEFLAETGDFFGFFEWMLWKSLFVFFLPQIARISQMIAYTIFNRDGL